MASPFAAIGFGLFFLCASSTAHFARIVWSDWFSWPIADWIAGAFLVYGGLRGARDQRQGQLHQVAGWAFLVSLLFGSFLADLQDWLLHIPDTPGTIGLLKIAQGPYVALVGVLLLVAVSGLVASIRPKPYEVL